LIDKTKQRLGYLEGVLSSIVNVVLFAFKLWAGLLTGSVAMIADAWHTILDTLSSFVVLLGFYISGKPYDKEHPFGHGRAEVIASIVIGILLTIVGFNFIKDSFIQLHEKKVIAYTPLSIMVFGVSAFVKEGLAWFSIRVGKKVDSKSLVADGWHHRSDAIASAIVVVGALLGGLFWWIDSVLGFIVSAFILLAAYDVTREGANILLGERIDTELKKQIQKIIEEEAPDVTGSHHFHVHRYGDHLEITLHLEMPGDYTLNNAHEIATRIENALRINLNVEPTIHFEPQSDNPDIHAYP